MPRPLVHGELSAEQGIETHLGGEGKRDPRVRARPVFAPDRRQPGGDGVAAETENRVRRCEERVGLGRRIDGVGVLSGQGWFREVLDDAHLVERDGHHRTDRDQGEAKDFAPLLEEAA
ncbi:MAG: hypothetical protein M3P91_02760 [Actinomycetota bacterium]|nr:hypothetical protein [Actinomycetota bacterium]